VTFLWERNYLLRHPPAYKGFVSSISYLHIKRSGTRHS
jgi:hypothetical protein